MTKWLVRVGVNSVILAAILFAVGVEWWRTIVVAVCAFVVLGSLQLWPMGTSAAWPMRATRSFGGGTYQVRSLANRLRQRHDRKRQPDSALQHRLRKLATAKLSRLDLDWADDRARELLGDTAYNALRADSFNPDLTTVDRILTAIDDLDSNLDRPQQRHTTSHR